MSIPVVEMTDLEKYRIAYRAGYIAGQEAVLTYLSGVAKLSPEAFAPLDAHDILARLITDIHCLPLPGDR